MKDSIGSLSSPSPSSPFEEGTTGYLLGAPCHLPARGAARAWACGFPGERVLAILPNSRELLDYVSDFEALFPEGRCFALPEIPLQGDQEERKPLLVHRGDLVGAWLREGGTLAATASGMLMPFAFSDGTFRIVRGEDGVRGSLLSWLVDKGYQRTDLVWLPGQYALRGALLDLLPPASSVGVRVAFDDEGVESLRLFDPETQRSVRTVEYRDVGAIRGKECLGFRELPLPEDLRIVLFEPGEAELAAENTHWLWEQLREEDPAMDSLESWTEFLLRFSSREIHRISEKVGGSGERIPLRPLPPFRGQLREAEAFLQERMREGVEVRYYGQTTFFREWARNLGASVEERILSEGFLDENRRVLFLSELDLTGVKVRPRSGSFSPPSDWGEDLTPGVLVLHEDYGVGRFLGTERMPLHGGIQEYFILEFAEGKRLLLPSYQESKLTRYDGVGGEDVSLDSLRRGHWKRVLEEAKKRAAEAAQKLLEAQARREISEGFPFPPLREETALLLDTFPYRETEDQIRAWEEIREDMERPVPMDRLLVGDVGFGKTELALRAAFKAAMGGKQVALITPTTLLAHQHGQTFRDRLSPFPLRVEVLSRFRTEAEQKEVLGALAEGKVDVVIGTHRLLSGDVRFARMGLLIVDEEHRFGVLHKEKWRAAFPAADVLLLSATPIPRTLHLALGGYRDLSVLATPPHHRRPVLTVVSPWSESLVRGAVLREKARGGQVFWVHNRIQSIHKQALRLRRLFPNLRLEVAHGRMKERELEEVMGRFVEGKTDLLLCTTIIESGLDLPRANTLVVDDAHDLGLAQLHQLRGRVGRREEQAFAFFLYPERAELSREARDRLEAIAELDELGGGLQLARRDLAIRGGGDLMGLLQHGHAARIGFERYCQLLEEQIRLLRGESLALPLVEWSFPVSIPPSYLEEERLRVRLYRRLSRVRTPEEAAALEEELTDRFGKAPHEVRLLLGGTRLRVLGWGMGERFRIGPHRMEAWLLPGLSLDPPKGWLREKDVWVGPGGLEGVASLCSFFEENRRPGEPLQV